MRFSSASLSLILLLSGAMMLRGQEAKSGSVFDAIRLLAPEQQAALAMVVGRDGEPVPERWHLLAHDPGAEGGLREFVVAGPAIVASRNVSQFAQSLTSGAVFEPGSIKVDSMRAAAMADAFCRANKAMQVAYHYDLRRGGATGAALWTIICVDGGSKELGRVIISAATGAVIGHPGFLIEPSREQLEGKEKKTAKRENSEPARPRPKASRPRPRQQQPIPRAEAVPTPRPNVFRRVFGDDD